MIYQGVEGTQQARIKENDKRECKNDENCLSCKRDRDLVGSPPSNIVN